MKVLPGPSFSFSFFSLYSSLEIPCLFDVLCYKCSQLYVCMYVCRDSFVIVILFLVSLTEFFSCSIFRLSFIVSVSVLNFLFISCFLILLTCLSIFFGTSLSFLRTIILNFSSSGISSVFFSLEVVARVIRFLWRY